MASGGLHHVEFCVGDGPATVNTFTKYYGFHVAATREAPNFRQWLLRCGRGQFLITSRKPLSKEGDESNENDSTPNSSLWSVFCCRGSNHVIDSAFDMALVVKDVDSCVERVLKNGGHLLHSKTIFGDGDSAAATVTSPVGNVVHTLIQRGTSNGNLLLPGFEAVKENAGNITSSNDVTHIDHVAMVVREGESSQVMEWYEACFGMSRFLINRDESLEEGMVISQDIGMRLRAMEFWKCSEVGLKYLDSEDRKNSLKIVLGETLPGYPNTQIEAFLRNHERPGIQHVALYTPNISKTVEKMAKSGAQFHYPPPTYYTKTGKLEEMLEAGEDPEKLQALGILLDAEADAFEEPNIEDNDKRYLMQIFTYPIFNRDTFFLEVIQRKGATGFGAGNIRALVQSVAEYHRQCQNQEQ